MLGVVGLPVPDETLLVFTGYLVYKGDLHFIPAFIAAFMGSVYGITLSYGLGRIGGAAFVTRYGYLFHLSDEKVSNVAKWLERRGKWALIFGYFIPGVRHLTAIVAGTSRLKYTIFAGFAYAGAFFWTFTFVILGYVSGREWSKTPEAVHRYVLITLCAGLVLALGLYFSRGGKNQENTDNLKT